MMIAIFAAALTCQFGTYPGAPGVIGGPLPIPAGSTPAQVARIQGINAQLASKPMAGVGYGGPVHYDTASRVDFAPMGGMFITPVKTGVRVLGKNYQDRYVSPFGQPILIPEIQSKNFVGPPRFGPRNPIVPAGF